MPPRDFGLLVLICLIWGLNVIVSKVTVSDLGIPPLFYAAVRSAVVMLAALPWLLPMPRPRVQMLTVVVLMGGAGFALLFIGLQTSAPSAAAVVSQLNIPITTVLSVVILGETIRWRRKLGILLTLCGALTVMWDPHGLELSTGLLFVAASAVAGSLGAVLMKRLHGIRPLQFQAWVGLSSVVLLAPLSAILEPNPWPSVAAAGWSFVGIVLFSALAVSMGAHTLYYGVIQRHDANLIAPLTLMTPLFTIAFGVTLMGDSFDLRMMIGTAVALCGVLIIALRPNRTVSPVLVVRDRF